MRATHSPCSQSRVLKALRTSASPANAQAHVPSYLKPETEGATETISAVGSSARRLKGLKKRKLYGGGKHAKKKDPLRNFQGAKKGGRKSKR